jgi:hypothetical protein
MEGDPRKWGVADIYTPLAYIICDENTNRRDYHNMGSKSLLLSVNVAQPSASIK